MTQPAQLKQYERDILRARSRVAVADLDNVIDELIAVLVGKLTRAEHKEYQAARLAELMGANPESVIARRAYLLGVSSKGISAPDILTMEELASLVIIMQAIADWLRECQLAGLTDIAFAELVDKAHVLAQNARRQFELAYQREPNIDDVPDRLMKVARARRVKAVADKAKIPLPTPRHQE